MNRKLLIDVSNTRVLILLVAIGVSLQFTSRVESKTYDENHLECGKLNASFAAPNNQRKPNVLFIAIDDQNDWIGCLKGHPQAQTPHIDGLAKRGTLFSNAHCQSPLCNPSRTSLMTGLRPSSTGIYGLAPWIKQLPEFQDYETLPQCFSKSGYRTYTTGKIYHGGNGRRKKDKEFDVIGTPAGVGVKPPKKLVDTPSSNPLVDWGVFPHKDSDKGDWKVADWAVKTLEGEIKDNPDQPFFLSVGFFLPHVPCYATQKWFDLYPKDKTELPPKNARLTPASRALMALSYISRLQYSSCPTEIKPLARSRPSGSVCVSTLEMYETS